MSATVQQADLGNILREHRERIAALELSDGSDGWIYVGTYPGDPGTTPESPPFENGWSNAGAPNAPVSFKMFLNWVHIRGAFTGGADGTVVFTLPAEYAPIYAQPSIGPLADGSGVWSYVVGTDGTVTYVTAGAL